MLWTDPKRECEHTNVNCGAETWWLNYLSKGAFVERFRRVSTDILDAGVADWKSTMVEVGEPEVVYSHCTQLSTTLYHLICGYQTDTFEPVVLFWPPDG